MKPKKSRSRECSAMLAAAAGAVVCLTGGGAVQAVSGSINASNGRVSFDYSSYPVFKVFGSRATFSIWTSSSMDIKPIGGNGTELLMSAMNTNVRKFAAGAPISSAIGGVWGGAQTSPPHQGHGTLLPPVSDEYFAVRFTDGGIRYGWVHVVNATNMMIQLDTWGYDTDGNITTLSDSVTTRKLPLADGKVKVHWTNANEDGVSRYEVQAKDASGEWQAIDSDTPGEGVYAAKVDNDAECRLVVEMVDGTTEEVEF